MIKEVKIEKKFDNLSNLREELRKVEPVQIAGESNEIRHAREGLISAHRSSRLTAFTAVELVLSAAENAMP